MPDDDVPNDDRAGRAMAKVPDALDRRILAALAQDATRSYAELGRIVGLSAPAVHERVRRLRADGTIRATVAQLDGAAVGKPLLAFVHVTATGWGKTPELMNMDRFPELEEIHSVSGDACLILKVRVASSAALEGFLKRLYEVPSVTNTRSYIALSTYLERPPQAGITAAFAPPALTREMP